MNGTELHQLLGAYLLGGLEPADAAAFEQHLESCAECRTELDELASLPALLDAVPVSDAVALTGVAAVAGRPGAGRRRGRLLFPSPGGCWMSWPFAAAKHASAGRRGGGRSRGLPRRAASSPGRCSTRRPSRTPATRSRPATALQFTVGLVKKTWGTELAVDGRSLPVDGTFSLWVKDRDGGEDRACAWTATPSGRVRITGATPVQLASIASVEMRNGQQQTVAVIAVPRG